MPLLLLTVWVSCVVRMAERSKALRSGRSPVFRAWVRIPLLTTTILFHASLARKKAVIPLGFEPRKSCVWGKRDNHYTMESNICIGRESNPGRPRGRRAFYHWTTDASCLTTFFAIGKEIRYILCETRSLSLNKSAHDFLNCWGKKNTKVPGWARTTNLSVNSRTR